MTVRTAAEPASLTIAVVEYVDKVSDGASWTALLFAEGPTLGFLKEAFPVGALVEGEDSAS
jgi:hypothetical protein